MCNVFQASNLSYSKKSFNKKFSFTKGIPDKVYILQKVWQRLPPFKLFPNRSAVIGYLDSTVYVAISDSTLFSIMNIHKEQCLKTFHDNVSFTIVAIRFRTHANINNLLAEFNGFTNMDNSRNSGTMPYHEYIQTAEWRQKAELKKKSVNHCCQVCNSSDNLHVHHRTYENMGNERDNDLTVLCKDCHQLFHKHRTIVIH